MVTKTVPGLRAIPIKLQLITGEIIDVEEFMTLYIYDEIFVNKDYDLLELDSQAPAIVDVGANTGLFALRMKQLYPDSRVFCYEPYPPNFEQLLVMIKKNKLQGVEAEMEGLGGIPRTERLFVHERNIGGHSIVNGVAGKNSVDIKLIGLEEALSRTPEGNIDLLKLDCEGAEYEIIKSITAEIGSKIKNIVFEPMPKLYDVADLSRHLESVGYEVRRDNGGIFVGSLLKDGTQEA